MKTIILASVLGLFSLSALAEDKTITFQTYVPVSTETKSPLIGKTVRIVLLDNVKISGTVKAISKTILTLDTEEGLVFVHLDKVLMTNVVPDTK